MILNKKIDWVLSDLYFLDCECYRDIFMIF